jgi:hypothetical protein
MLTAKTAILLILKLSPIWSLHLMPTIGVAKPTNIVDLG